MAEERKQVDRFGPVRKIGVQTRSMTGTMPCGNRYESSLERDLMELLRMDPNFLKYHAQPVKVPLLDRETGRTSTYTPDGLIFWRSSRRPWLVEVKHRADCVGQFRHFLRKFRAARSYAAERDWEFRVLTETHIRGQRLLNLKFLHRFKAYPVNQPIQQDIREAVGVQGATVNDLLSRLGATRLSQPLLVSEIWRMVAHGELAVDLQKPLNNEVPLSLA